ncbi:MAG: ABC transporter permease [Oscillospiraceae bacterium]|jgi:NitT/TauT family transport system permease protein|nr:ABC transporter permease [Oscillospiraceae bacterium]
MKNIGRKAYRIFYGLIALIVFLALWEIAARLELLVNPLFLPPFTKVLGTLWRITVSGELWKHASVSLRRSLTGYVIGLAFAVPFGLAIGWFRKLGDLMSPLLNVFRNIPVLALLPVFVMFFGITETAKVVVIFWGVLWSVLLNTISGVRSVDAQLIRAARSMGTGSVRMFATVVLPASLPHIFTGMRISATTSILILIAAEMLGANKGLGYELNFYQANMKFPEMYAYIVIMAALGVALNAALERVEKRSFRWRKDAE